MFIESKIEKKNLVSAKPETQTLRDKDLTEKTTNKQTHKQNQKLEQKKPLEKPRK